jgi:hypothetical protein
VRAPDCPVQEAHIAELTGLLRDLATLAIQAAE